MRRGRRQVRKGEFLADGELAHPQRIQPADAAALLARAHAAAAAAHAVAAHAHAVPAAAVPAAAEAELECSSAARRSAFSRDEPDEPDAPGLGFSVRFCVSAHVFQHWC